MFVNTLIVLFIIAMTCWWGVAQGLFSAFLQLVITTIAAGLAIALWEPFVLGVLIWHIPNYAWAVGLLGPFVLWLVVLRTVAGIFVPTGIELARAIDIIGGSVCGLLTAVLASGLTVLGAGFLPLPPGAGGYRPIVIQEKWRVAENPDGGLWLPVDRYARRFLDTLSVGAFASSQPLAKYQPDLVLQAALLRMRYDPERTMVAVPHSVKVGDAFGWLMPVKGLDDAFSGLLTDRLHPLGNQLIVVDTEWPVNHHTVDADGVLRVPPTQIRLVTWRRDLDTPGMSLYAPVGWVEIDPISQKRVYTPFNGPDKPVFNLNQSPDQLLAWVFVVPVEEEIGFIMVRGLRLRLPGLNTDPITLVAALGLPRQAGPTTQPTIDR